VAHVLWIYLKNINKSYMLAYVFVEQSWYGGVVKKKEEQSMENKETFDSKFVFLQKKVCIL
jgi:hypothetical protein